MGAGERGAEPAPGSPAFPPRRCCRLFSKPLFFLSTFFSSFSLCLCQPRRRWRSFAVGKEGVRQMTVLPSRRGTLQSVGATALISCKWEMFRCPFLVFHWQWKAEPPKREVLIPGLTVPAAPLFAHPQPLTLPKAGCSPPTRGFCTPEHSQWILGQELCSEESQAGSEGPWSPQAPRVPALAHAQLGREQPPLCGWC